MAIKNGSKKRTFQTNDFVLSLKLLNNKDHLPVGLGYPNSGINIYSINNGSLVSSIKGHTNYVTDFVQKSDDLLASSGYDNTVRI